MSVPLYDKDLIFSFLKKLQSDILNVFSEMKLDFEKNPPVSNIKERFLVFFYYLVKCFKFLIKEMEI